MHPPLWRGDSRRTRVGDMHQDEPRDSEYSPRTNAFQTLLDKIYFHRLPAYGNTIFYGLGFLALTCLVLLAASGMTLAFMGQAWWLANPLGIYVRSLHLWTVQAFIFILILHALVGFATSAFRKPRRMVWVFGAIIFCLVLIQTEFGYGLRGDFESQFRAVSGADFWNGAYLGNLMNPLSHLQEFALHVAIIPITILLLFIAHYLLVHTYGISRPYREDITVPLVPADHRVMYARGVALITLIAILAFFFHSPYVKAITIADVAREKPALVAANLQAEFDRTSDTATYFDSMDPYTFDTRQVYVLMPYTLVTGADAATSSSVMIAALMPAIRNGIYESILTSADPVPDTYALRFLSDMNVFETKASSLNMSTAQWGMIKDETGSTAKLPPGSWWLIPLGVVNSAFDLLHNSAGDRIAGEILGFVMFLFITFPYIPYLNRLPEKLGLAPFIWRRGKKT